MKAIPKQYIIISILVVLLVAGVVMFTRSQKNTTNADTVEKETVFEEQPEVIPTVDASVKVEIEGNKNAVMTITGIPKGTENIEYELTYDTATGSIEGVFGTIEFAEGDMSAEEEFIFGTSSSGVNRYHTIKGAVKGTFKFSGSYGERILEKEFDL